ncbi:hypothetical protein [Streptomyces sp. NPDC000961]|uniref:hypothetical protein n=1 Tax=Streptomyces sp. NPDC000961 TaxID=3364541 RepID=UPI0036BEDFDB
MSTLNERSAGESHDEKDEFDGSHGVVIDFSGETARRAIVDEAHTEAQAMADRYQARWKQYRRERVARRRALEADPAPDYLKPWAHLLTYKGVVEVPSFERPILGSDETETITPDKFTRSEFVEGVRRHFGLASFDLGDWSEFTPKEREMSEFLGSNGHLDSIGLPAVGDADALTLPPTRRAFEAALRKYNPSVDVGTVADPVVGNRVMLMDSHWVACREPECPECEEADERGEYGRGLGVAGKTQTIFGPKESGKTWYEVLAAKEAISWGYNVLHYEADDSREALPKRLVFAGVDPLDVARHVKVITADQIQVESDGSRRLPVTPELPEAFARNIGLVTLDAVTSMASELNLDSKADTLTKTFMSRLMEPFYRRSQVGAHGIIVDHTGHEKPDRPANSAQKLAAVRSAYQVRPLSGGARPPGVGRLGCVELVLQKDSHSIHPGKRNGDVVAYMDVDARGETVRLEVYEQHPDKRRATPNRRGKSGLGEVKALIHAWLTENADEATSTRAEIWEGLRGTIKSSGKPITKTDVNNNLNRLTEDDPIRALSDDRFRAL